MAKKTGGVIHTYLKYQPQKFPSPTAPPPDMVSPLMNQMLAYGSMRELTDEELARAIRLDPSQFQNLGPSLDMIKAMLEEEAEELAGGVNENEQAKDLTAPLVSAEPEIASMVRSDGCTVVSLSVNVEQKRLSNKHNVPMVFFLDYFVRC